MIASIVIKLFLTVIFAGCAAYDVYTHDQNEKGLNPSVKAPRYPSYSGGIWVLIILLCIWLLYGFLYGPRSTFLTSINLFVGTLIQISLYFLILLTLLPLLRRRISARVCAMLWLLPGCLFIYNSYYTGFLYPPAVIPVSLKAVEFVFGVWLAGFAGVMGYQIATHLWFRRRLLRGAVPVTDEEVLEVWEEELHRANLRKPRFRLVVSPQAVTPLTVGLFRRTARVVLPQRQYTPEDLTLIFRHELIHLGRDDAWSKFFLTFCTAACWFNPLVWLAMKKSADDMELSCDETVLLGCKEEVRLRYANLLLKTAGDQRGFTTCLSASARALRYRLGSVIAPPALWRWLWPPCCCFSPAAMWLWATRRAVGRRPCSRVWTPTPLPCPISPAKVSLTSTCISATTRRACGTICAPWTWRRYWATTTLIWKRTTIF